MTPPIPEQLVPASAVLELPGLYGPFAFTEKLLQKIWLRRSFDEEGASTTDGRTLKLIHPGKWNLIGGPDFRNARLRLGDGPEISGDIELHLHSGDWDVHRHAADPAYNNVVLHVVLFTPGASHRTRGADGREIPVLVLLPLLLHDLEEYAEQEVIEALANRPVTQIVEMLGILSVADLHALLTRLAENRWRQKIHYARLRIQRLGWVEACHHTALEILGYRFNRVAMLRVASATPLSNWRERALDLEIVFGSGNDWNLQALRPANHPRVRLKQYSAWICAQPDWPATLRTLGNGLPIVANSTGTAATRRVHAFGELRQRWSESIAGGAIGGTRFDNIICDGFFPLLAASGSCDPRPFWFHWFPGDVPPLWNQALRQLEMFSGRPRPACHGLVQGLLGWLIEREQTTTVPAGRSA